MFRVLAVLLGVAIGLGALGWPSLIAPWFATGSHARDRVHDLAYGAAGGLLLAAPLTVAGWRPEPNVAAMQEAVLAASAFLIAQAVAGDLDAFTPIMLAVVLVVAWTHPARTDLVRLWGRPSLS